MTSLPTNDHNYNNQDKTQTIPFRHMYVSFSSANSSTTSSTVGSPSNKNNKQKKNTENEADESYASCAEEVDYTNAYLIRNSSPTTLVAPNLPTAIPAAASAINNTEAIT